MGADRGNFDGKWILQVTFIKTDFSYMCKNIDVPVFPSRICPMSKTYGWETGGELSLLRPRYIKILHHAFLFDSCIAM